MTRIFVGIPCNLVVKQYANKKSSYMLCYNLDPYNPQKSDFHDRINEEYENLSIEGKLLHYYNFFLGCFFSNIAKS